MCDRHSAVPMTDAVQETRLRCHHPTVPLCEGRQSWYSLPSWLIQPMRSSCSLRRDRVPLGWCGAWAQHRHILASSGAAISWELCVLASPAQRSSPFGRMGLHSHRPGNGSSAPVCSLVWVRFRV